MPVKRLMVVRFHHNAHRIIFRMFFNWYYKKRIGGNLYELQYEIGGVKAKARNKDACVLHEIIKEFKKQNVPVTYSLINEGGIVLETNKEG